MENQSKETQTMLKLVKKSDIFKLIIPEEVENKIRYICSQIRQNEWSGTLFYKPEGSFEDGTLVIRCVDIYVMDIGTAAYTEFDMSPEVISYMTENKELLDCQMGLVHSHAQMATFFSSIDISTLKEEGKDRNHFVSLIVNNEGTYTAAITRKVLSNKNITDIFTYPSFEDKVIKDNKTYTFETEELEYYYLEIEFERDNGFYKSLEKRLEEIKILKEEKAKTINFSKAVTNMYMRDYTQQDYKHNAEQLNIVKNYDLELPLDWDYTDDKINDFISCYKIHFNKNIIKSIILQLITGSIIIPNESKIDPKKWVKGMPSLFEKRFGKGEEGLKQFKSWAEGYIEYLCWFTKDDALLKEGLDDDIIVSICAKDMIEALTELPDNNYIKIYIDILKGYIYE